MLGVVALVALTFGCQAKIGDSCRRSTDCSIRGERTCDLSNRTNGQGVRTPNGQGECIIEGCGRGTCPKEGTCVKVYGTDFLSVSCDPVREDVAIACDPDEQDCPADCAPASSGDALSCPPRNDCESNEVCLPEGLCADEITARTSCRARCKNNGDCRNGYECRRTGHDGVYRAPNADFPLDDSEIGVCRPRG